MGSEEKTEGINYQDVSSSEVNIGGLDLPECSRAEQVMAVTELIPVLEEGDKEILLQIDDKLRGVIDLFLSEEPELAGRFSGARPQEGVSEEVKEEISRGLEEGMLNEILTKIEDSKSAKFLSMIFIIQGIDGLNLELDMPPEKKNNRILLVQLLWSMKVFIVTGEKYGESFECSEMHDSRRDGLMNYALDAFEKYGIKWKEEDGREKDFQAIAQQVFEKVESKIEDIGNEES